MYTFTFISFHLIKVLAWSFEDPAKAVGSETEVILITWFDNDLINYSWMIGECFLGAVMEFMIIWERITT